MLVGPNRKQRGGIELVATSTQRHPVCQKYEKQRSLEQAARDKIKKHRDAYNLLQGDIGFLPLVASTSGRLNADFIRLVHLHATKETKAHLDAIDLVDAEDGHEADAAGGRRDREFLVQRSRFLAALKTRLGLSDRASMKSHARIFHLIASAIDHDLHTLV